MKTAFVTLLTAVLLGGCQQLKEPLANLPEVIQIVRVEDQSARRWLRQLDETMKLNEEQAEQQLKEMTGKKSKDPERLFQYALLNQQLHDRLGWIRARDSLRELQQQGGMSANLETLVTLLLFHNQQMINNDVRHTRLLEALDQEQQWRESTAQALLRSQVQATELSEKIKALTTLEKSISIRRTLDSENGNSHSNGNGKGNGKSLNNE